MLDKKLIKSLSNSDKEIFKKGLEDLIQQTYVIENEYKILNESYHGLQSFISQIVETMPNALWVLEKDGSIFLNNSEALKLNELLKYIDITKSDYELQYKQNSYLIKITNKNEKTIIQATDITGEKRKQRLMSMGQVAAHLSHEIRNPIGSISILTSTLFNKVDFKCKPIVYEIKKSIWRVERIIKATLLFTKGLHVNKANFYIKDLINECQNATQYYSYCKDISFDYQLYNDEIFADKDLISLVLQNLLFNAIDAIEESENENGNITISYTTKDDFSIIHVMDNGTLVQNEQILFEPFESTKTKGNGLGLTLCKQIAQAHDGDIEYISSPKSFCLKIKNIQA